MPGSAHSWLRARGASASLRLAAWLHDLGHLLSGLPGSPTLRGIDDRHEALGAAALASAVRRRRCRPVALHVQAKRCLVAMHADYARCLSADSVRSLALQGGPMDAAECQAYLALPFARDAMRLRAWDDQAKQPDWRCDSETRARRTGRAAGRVAARPGCGPGAPLMCRLLTICTTSD